MAPLTRYGRSPWIDSFPKSRVPSYPRYKGDASNKVVVVGGGLTGCACAYAFAAAGIDVMLLEAGQIGRGSSGSSAGVIASDPGVAFVDVEKALGLRAARHAWQMWRRAALDFTALIRRLDIRCGLEPRTALTLALTPEQAVRLKRETKIRRDAGLEASLLNARAAAAAAAIPATGGVRTTGAATIDPYRAALGLASAAVERGTRIFERSPVRRITFTRKIAFVHTASATIKAERVVVATGLPTSLFKALARHFWFRTTYMALTARVPARVGQRLAPHATLVRDAAEPPHLVRWADAERLLVMGADAAPPPPRQRDRTLVQRTGQLMYELSTLFPEISGIIPEYGWDAPYARAADGLPCFGPHRNFPFQLFAFGDASHSVTGAYLASRILLRHHLGETESGDEVFGFARGERLIG